MISNSQVIRCKAFSIENLNMFRNLKLRLSKLKINRGRKFLYSNTLRLINFSTHFVKIQQIMRQTAKSIRKERKYRKNNSHLNALPKPDMKDKSETDKENDKNNTKKKKGKNPSIPKNFSF